MTGIGGEAPALGGMALAWLDIDETARLLADESLKVLWANRAAREYLADETDFELRGDVLVASDRTCHAQLVSAVREATESLAPLCLSCGDRNGHHVVGLRQVSTIGEQRIIAMSFRRTTSPATERYVDFVSAFQLTHGEHRVVCRMLDGLTADKISTEAKLSVETIRTHIRNIYAKIGVKSREELFAHLWRYRV